MVNELKVNLENVPELPPDSHSFFLTAERELSLPGEISVSVRDTGAGPPVLLLPGIHYGAYSFRYLLSARERFRLVLVDLFVPGGVQLATGAALEALHDILVSVEAALALDGALWVAQGELALAALAAGVRRSVSPRALVVISPPSPQTRWQQLQARLSGRSRRKEKMAQRFANDPFRAAADLVDYADPTVISRQELRWQARRLATWPAARALAGNLQALAHPELTRPLEQLIEKVAGSSAPFPVPLRILSGTAGNQAKQEFARTLNRTFTGSELLPVESCGDAVQAEQPARVLEVLDSLAAS